MGLFLFIFSLITYYLTRWPFRTCSLWKFRFGICLFFFTNENGVNIIRKLNKITKPFLLLLKPLNLVRMCWTTSNEHFFLFYCCRCHLVCSVMPDPFASERKSPFVYPARRIDWNRKFTRTPCHNVDWAMYYLANEVLRARRGSSNSRIKVFTINFCHAVSFILHFPHCLPYKNDQYFDFSAESNLGSCRRWKKGLESGSVFMQIAQVNVIACIS